MSRKTRNKTKTEIKRATKRRKEKHRRANQKYRKKIKRNEKFYEEYKAKDRLRKQKAKEEGKLKPLSHRQQVKKRKEHRVYMREYSRKKREQANLNVEEAKSKDLNEKISSHGYDENLTPTKVLSKQQTNGQKQVKRDRSKLYRENQRLKTQVSDLQKQMWKLEKREVRGKMNTASPDLTPRKKLGRILAGKFTSSPVRRELLKGLVVQEELKTSVKKIQDNIREKTTYARFVIGTIIKKYRLLNQCRNIIPKH